MARAEIAVEYEDWHAVHDFMGKTLRVSGTCIVEGGGVALGLEPREEQGINPQMLMLNLSATATGESPSRQTVEHVQPWSDDGIQYTEVGFVAVGGVAFSPPPQLKVEDAH
ncbi:MAG: hypothetical protein QOI95_297 [Acidimicrobiaceae bacterium]